MIKIIYFLAFSLLLNCVFSCTLGTQTGCNTAIAANLTEQIVKELGVMGYKFARLNSQYIHCNSPCYPELQTEAANSLVQAAKAKNDYITLNSAFRSSAQQYLLYSWYKKGICSISLAAVPGKSNHEGGRAIDTSYYNFWKTTLESYGWVYPYPSSDPVHFDYTRVADLAKQNLLAFQRLYNKNNPTKKISEDGVYGPATEKAFSETPCSGWK